MKKYFFAIAGLFFGIPAVTTAQWSITGNSGTNPSTNFLGTTDAQPLILKTNNGERIRLLSTGHAGFGTSTPTARLEILSSETATFAAGFNNNLRLTGVAPGMQFCDSDHAKGWQISSDAGTLQFYLLNYQNQISVSPMGFLPNGNIRMGNLQRSESDAKLTVDGTVYAKKIKVIQTGWADYVFNKDYQLLSLLQVESFINKNKHLPGVPSAAEVEDKGIDVAETQAMLLKKIEELTLYTIEQEKRIEQLQREMEEMKKGRSKTKAETSK